jgi:hypothetical protein
MNPSYFAPGYYQAFAQFDAAGAALWTKAVADSYATFADVQNDQSGLLPAWSSANQVQIQNCTFQVDGGGAPDTYQSDAARTPWRVATDLAWTGSTGARTFLTPMVNWLNTSNRLTHIVDVYALTGVALNGAVQLNNMTLDATGRRSTITMGAFATAGIAGTQAELDRLVGAWQSLYRAGDDLGPGGITQPHAFNNSLALLYGMLATGTMWNPLGADPTPLPEAPLVDQPGNAIINGDFDEGIRGWNMENLGGIAAEGFAVHESGELRILLQKVTGLPDEQYMVRLRQPVTLTAGQNYRLSISARAAEPRVMRMFVGQRDEPYATYLALDSDPEAEGAALNLTTEMQTFQVVLQAPATTGAVQLALDLADSAAEVVIDNIIVAPTTDPVTAPGTPIVAPPVAGAPGGGTGEVPAGGGNLGPIAPVGDSTNGPVSPVPGPGDQTGGLPPAPTATPGAGSCTAQTQAGCAPAACSIPLGLCYDPATGYVWSPAQATYTEPPRGVLPCGPDQVSLPTSPEVTLCYIPETGWIYNPTGTPPGWQFYGVNYTRGENPEAEDSGCAVNGAPASRSGSSWLLVGLLGTALGFAYRRRTA